MCGAPPVAGFISKWHLCLGSVQAGSMILLSVILISSLLDVIYFFPIVKKAFFEPPGKELSSGGINPRSVKNNRGLKLFMAAPLSATAVFSIIFCFFPGLFYIMDLAELVVEALF
jgi:formate hydrogenlyase subunit 3/multisubunit Na+/H+ antiporter MnhD subunit